MITVGEDYVTISYAENIVIIQRGDVAISMTKKQAAFVIKWLAEFLYDNLED